MVGPKKKKKKEVKDGRTGMLPTPRLSHTPKWVSPYNLLAWCLSPGRDPLPLLRMMCGGSTSPGFPRKTTLAKEGSKVRSSQCGIIAPGGHPNPAVPCLILRKLFNVSSSRSSSWGGGSHSYSAAQTDGQGPLTRRGSH